MKLTVVQFNPLLGETARNCSYILDTIKKTDTKIIVFPELATSGYFFQATAEAAKCGEKAGGPFFSQVQELASSIDKIIIYGFPEKSGAKVYNSAAVIFPNNKLSSVYRKTHLFYKERFCFTPGDTGFNVIHDHDAGISIGTMICYDWRFPESARTLGLKGADLIVCPSNLVTDVWHIAMPARALENKVYLAVANRTGSERKAGEELVFTGKSAIYGYNGSVMAEADTASDNILSVDITPSKTRDKSFNEFNDINTDRRPKFYYR